MSDGDPCLDPNKIRFRACFQIINRIENMKRTAFIWFLVTFNLFLLLAIFPMQVGKFLKEFLFFAFSKLALTQEALGGVFSVNMRLFDQSRNQLQWLFQTSVIFVFFFYFIFVTW